MDGLRTIFRFGDFEFNRKDRELRRNGSKVKLQGLPLRVLALFLDRPGEVLTRDELRAELWPEDTFVDFEHSLNSAIKKLRHALGDSASDPRFIETLARQGYRFIAAVDAREEPVGLTPPQQLAQRRASTRRRSRWLYAGPAVAVAVLVVVLTRHRAERPLVSGLTMILTGQGDVSDPSVSPDGAMVAYSQGHGASAGIYVRRLAGGSPVAVSQGDGRDAEPAFSPDGERIAFTRYPPNAARPEIWIVPVLGGEMRLVLRGARNPAWSPGGRRLAFILYRPGTGEALATSIADGTGVRIILPPDTTYPFLHFPSWSADGRVIAVERSLGGVSGEVWIVPSNGGTPSPVDRPSRGIYLHHPVFTPDGIGLIYASNRSGATNLWYHSLKDGTATEITRGPGPEEWPSVSRTGRIVFLNAKSKDILFTRRLDTGVTTAILSYSPYLWAPAISPDGREIAFSQAEYNGSWCIWIVPTAGGKPSPLTSGEAPQVYSRFSRDGRWITYFTWAAGADRIWLIPSKGGTAEPLTPSGEDASYGDLSPDGRELAFTRTEKHSAHVCVMTVPGGPERRLTSFPSTLPRWSPDGQWIAFSPDRSFQGGIYIIRPDGSNMRKLTESGSWPVWLSDGRQIAFRTLGADGNQQLNIVRLSDNVVRPLTGVRFSGYNYPIDFSLDGKIMAYTNGETFSSEVWVLDRRR